MKYKPSRDIPIAVRELKTLSPTDIVKWIREHRTEIDKISKKRRQVNRTPESVSMWFRDHPEIEEQLKNEIGQEEIPKEAITEAIFQNGFFEQIPCIKQWIIDLRNKGAKEESIKYYFLNSIKRICKGQIGKEIIEQWGLKHPQNLSIKDGKLYISELHKRGKRTRQYRLALRNFLTSKGIVVKSSDITGELEEDAGKYADLFVSKEDIYKILNWLKQMNVDAYLMSLFSFKTGARLSATLNADSSFINKYEHKITVLEKAKKGKKKRRIVKYIPDDLWNELTKYGKIEKKGKLFNITVEDLNNLLRSAYKQIIPTIEKRIPMPFHFWRHMFGQHMLRANNWNHTLVGKLGGWSTEALERYYGKMPFDKAVEIGKLSLNNL